MSEWDKAKENLVSRFQRDGVVVGTPESIARETGFSTHVVEEALADLVREDKIQPFQDDKGTLEYQWKASYPKE